MNINTSPQDLVKEARSVRDDGQCPKSSAEDFERALLWVAHREQKPSEDFPTALARVVATDDACAALIFAADRVRDAAAFVGKSAPSAPSSAIATDAERVSKGAAPGYSKDDYHDEMMRLSKAAARSGESPAVAFARLAGEGHFDALYAAGERAEVVEVEAAMTKAAPEDRFYPLLLDLAQMRKRSGETIDAACARLLAEDPIVRDAYASTQGL